MGDSATPPCSPTACLRQIAPDFDDEGVNGPLFPLAVPVLTLVRRHRQYLPHRVGFPLFTRPQENRSLFFGRLPGVSVGVPLGFSRVELKGRKVGAAQAVDRGRTRPGGASCLRRVANSSLSTRWTSHRTAMRSFSRLRTSLGDEATGAKLTCGVEGSLGIATRS